ncbi:sigma factor [Flavivirga aquimarina]|uniref:Sigma factor n=1 Tax=Flavivirga aquimarina TaxID=2027862 RepID=A0ABT8WCX6_9FLAO|nr:sigma factor [Flavivirga aquimarina]MDO5970898.1 sigma factor [Flavivirga aquimarina]
MSENKNDFTLKSYKSFFEYLYPQLCVFANKYLNDWEISKDVVQEVFVKVWEDRIVFLNEKYITNYFYKAVKMNVSIT